MKLKLLLPPHPEWREGEVRPFAVRLCQLAFPGVPLRVVESDKADQVRVVVLFDQEDREAWPNEIRSAIGGYVHTRLEEALRTFATTEGTLDERACIVERLTGIPRWMILDSYLAARSVSPAPASPDAALGSSSIRFLGPPNSASRASRSGVRSSG